MGWPRRNDVCRLYREKKDKSFLLVFNPTNACGNHDAIGNAIAGADPCLASCSVSPDYLLTNCRRVQWSDLPKDWQRSFRLWLTTPPKRLRGLWKVGVQP